MCLTRIFPQFPENAQVGANGTTFFFQDRNRVRRYENKYRDRLDFNPSITFWQLPKGQTGAVEGLRGLKKQI